MTSTQEFNGAHADVRARPLPPAAQARQDQRPGIFAHYNLPPVEPSEPYKPPDSLFQIRADVRSEESLTSVYELLESAAATAYESVANLSGANRKVVRGVVHLVELAKALVDSALNKRGGEYL